MHGCSVCLLAGLGGQMCNCLCASVPFHKVSSCCLWWFLRLAILHGASCQPQNVGIQVPCIPSMPFDHARNPPFLRVERPFHWLGDPIALSVVWTGLPQLVQNLLILVVERQFQQPFTDQARLGTSLHAEFLKTSGYRRSPHVYAFVFLHASPSSPSKGTKSQTQHDR